MALGIARIDCREIALNVGCGSIGVIIGSSSDIAGDPKEYLESRKNVPDPTIKTQLI